MHSLCSLTTNYSEYAHCMAAIVAKIPALSSYQSEFSSGYLSGEHRIILNNFLHSKCYLHVTLLFCTQALAPTSEALV